MHSIILQAILSALMLDTFGRVAALIFGVLLMIGSLWAYRKMGVDGAFAAWVSIGGFVLILFGIGGEALINAMSR